MSAPLDITREVCPMTYVRVKVRLEQLDEGAALEVRLRGEEPLKNVPKSAADEGHEVVSLDPDAAAPGEWRLVLRKGQGKGGRADAVLPQLGRYARQVLVPEVGARGQRALGELAASVSTADSAEGVAAAYLAAGGTPLARRASAGAAEGDGGFFGAQRLDAASELNPDAAQRGTASGWIGERPAEPSGSRPWVAIGWRGGRGGVAFAAADGCPDCFALTVGALDEPIPPEASVALGSMAALMFQRCALGRAEPLGGAWVDRAGAMTPMAVSLCPRHR